MPRRNSGSTEVRLIRAVVPIIYLILISNQIFLHLDWSFMIVCFWYKKRKHDLVWAKSLVTSFNNICCPGLHAREWITPATVTWMINEIVTNYEANKDIVDAYQWYFLPVHNPDGYEYSHTDVSWYLLPSTLNIPWRDDFWQMIYNAKAIE
jgi:hypothetical protein